MSKSVLTILVIGVIGAVLMSLVMKHLVEVASERDRSPYAAAVESRLGAKKVGPVRIVQEVSGEQVHLKVHARVLAGLNKQVLADSVGLEVWLGALRAGARLDEVSVILADDDGGNVSVHAIASPTTRRRDARSGASKPLQNKGLPSQPSGGVPASGSAATPSGGGLAPAQQGPVPVPAAPKAPGAKPRR